jgi:hypothetical protein
VSPRWERIGGTVSLAGFTLIVTAMAIYGLAGYVQ